jgi:hypothetical protein
MSFPRHIVVHISSTEDFELLQKFLITHRFSCTYDEVKSEAYMSTSGNLYKPRKDTREFWGAEFLNRDCFLSHTDAIRRLTLYGQQNNLLIPSGISLDYTLQCVLGTTQTELLWNDLHKHLSVM